jgi:hypothetical protein
VILNYFQPPRVFRSSSPSQPKDTVMADGMGPAGSGPLDQGYVDEQRSLEAAVSEGWPISPHRTRGTDLRPQQPYRTEDQTAVKLWRRRSTVKGSGMMGVRVAAAGSSRECAPGRIKST